MIFPATLDIELACRKWRAILMLVPIIVLDLAAGRTFAGTLPIPPRTPAADVYVPVDNWVYDSLDRLHGLGYLNTAFLGLRPWTRASIATMLAEADGEDGIHEDAQAEEIYRTLVLLFPARDREEVSRWRSPKFSCDETYEVVRVFSGLPLRDSFHLGQTISNDYGRAYAKGLNNYTGIAGSAQAGGLSIYVRGEFQHAPSSAGYSQSLFNLLSSIDGVPLASNPKQATIPLGPIPSVNTIHLLEANLSYKVLRHEIAFGKSDHWMSPAKGGSFLYSNNAPNLYAFQIDRTEPLDVPLLSRLTGPFRYTFFVGSLKGHSDPNDPWLHVEKVSFQPTANLEFGFSRATIWGGKGHAPITVHSFLASFFSFQNTSVARKLSREDPGARFGTFDFNWRLPVLSHWVTLYSDSLVHDDVSPIDAPRHAGVRPGIYLSELPGLPRISMRVEGVNTDPPTSRSNGGSYLYAETIQLQGYTNAGLLIGDSFGRESKGGQGWMTYYFTPHELIQASFRSVKVSKDFVPRGTTQDSLDLHIVKVFGRQVELSGDLVHEWWKAPVYQPQSHSATGINLKVKWTP